MAWWKLKSGQNGKSTDLQSDHSGDGWIEWDDNDGDQETNQGEDETKRDGPGDDQGGESTEEIGLGTGTPYRMLSGTDTGRISISARERYWTAKLDGSKIKEVIRKLRECGNWEGRRQRKTTKDNNRSVFGANEKRKEANRSLFTSGISQFDVLSKCPDEAARCTSAISWLAEREESKGGKCTAIRSHAFFLQILSRHFLSPLSFSFSPYSFFPPICSKNTQPFQLTSDCVLGTKSIASLGIQNRQLLSMKNSTQIDCSNVSGRKFPEKEKSTTRLTDFSDHENMIFQISLKISKIRIIPRD